MRFVCFAFISCFSLFVTVQPALSQDSSSAEVKASEAPRKGVIDYINGLGKKIYGRKPHYDPKGLYLRDGITSHDNQWDNVDWRPEYWVEDKGSIEAVINGFYDGGIIARQYNDSVPVLEVGRPFLRLSPLDQRHVVEFVDYAFNVTKKQSNGIFYIVVAGEDDKKLLGLYSENGLQLQ